MRWPAGDPARGGRSISARTRCTGGGGGDPAGQPSPVAAQLSGPADDRDANRTGQPADASITKRRFVGGPGPAWPPSPCSLTTRWSAWAARIIPSTSWTMSPGTSLACQAKGIPPHDLYLEIAGRTWAARPRSSSAASADLWRAFIEARRRFLAAAIGPEPSWRPGWAIGLVGYMVSSLFLHGCLSFICSGCRSPLSSRCASWPARRARSAA